MVAFLPQPNHINGFTNSAQILNFDQKAEKTYICKDIKILRFGGLISPAIIADCFYAQSNLMIYDTLTTHPSCAINNDLTILQTTDIGWKAKGYRMKGISGYGSMNPLFAAVWDTNNGKENIVKTNLTPGEFLQSNNDYRNNGYTLLCVDPYHVNNLLQYAAIWENTGRTNYETCQGLTSEQFEEKIDYYDQRNYRPVHISSCNVDGLPCYTGIWTREAGPESLIKHDMPGLDFQKANTRLSADGYTLAHLTGCCCDLEPTFAGIWQKTDSLTTNFDTALPTDEFILIKIEMERRGLYPSCISGYNAHNKNYFAVVWEKNNEN